MVAVLLFALVTSLLYQDLVDFLQQQYPGTVIYALTAKIVIVYGALVFVLLQFRPGPDERKSTAPRQSMDDMKDSSTVEELSVVSPSDRLAGLEDVTKTTTLRSRYDKVIDGYDDRESGRGSSSRE